MVNSKLNYAVKFTITSIIIGSILGLVGASAAHYFRVGIVLISDGFSQIISSSYGFFYYVFTLSVAALIVHQVKKLNTGKPFRALQIVFSTHTGPTMRQI